MARPRLESALVLAAALGLPAFVAWGAGREPPAPASAPEVVLGRRLFRDVRFSQPHAAGGGAPVSCATCHLSDEAARAPRRGPRAFCDFECRSGIPPRADGRTTTARNTPTLADAASPRTVGLFLHFDGRYGSVEDLAADTLTGRNLGWLPAERAAAVAHVARVLRTDDGTDGNARAHGGGAYAPLLAGTEAPGGARPLPGAYRLDVARATDAEALAAVGRLLAAYVRSLATRPGGMRARGFRSPYDLFLAKNRLPTGPDPEEPDLDYGRRLRTALLALRAPREVGPADGAYRTHAHPFRFGDLERRGLLVFLTEPVRGATAPEGVSPGGVGSCVTCHAPPSFTDGLFHNVGASQVEYDAVHGLGAFARLRVPELRERNADPERWLPPSDAHPEAKGPFLAEPRRDDPGLADLGLWNVFANPDVPTPQPDLRRMVVLGRMGWRADASDAALLEATLGWMKTPTLRNLGHSAPYFHGGHVATLEAAMQHYRAAGFSARTGQIRNRAPELAGIDLSVQDLVALAAFLRALDEDPPGE